MARPAKQPQRPPKTPKRPQQQPERRVRTPALPGITDSLSLAIRQLRIAKGLSQREAAERMVINGVAHSSVAGNLARIKQEGATKDLNNALGKAWARIESGVQHHTDSELFYVAHVLEVDVATIWQAAGLSKPQFSSEDAILTDRRLSGAGRQAVLIVLRSQIQDVPDDE